MMLALVTVLAVLAARIFACLPPTNATLDIGGHYFGPWFGNNKSGLWPKNDKGIRVVGYCYQDQASFDKLSAHVALGWATWYSKLDQPGSAHGHSLSFERVYIPGDANPWCGDGKGNWNSDIAKDSLVIQLGGDAEIGGETTVGYTPDSKNNVAGRHHMKMGAAATDWDFAHELGHAFSLLHEHQRPDRDDHVVYSCAMLINHDDALHRASGKGHSEDELCNSARCAAEFSFAAYQFTKNGELVDPSTGSKESDIDSIMPYISENFADPEKFKDHRGDADYCPLVKKDGGGKKVIAEPEPFPDFGITDLDVKGVKAMYPWQ